MTAPLSALAMAQLFALFSNTFIVATAAFFVRHYANPLYRYWLAGTAALAVFQLTEWLSGPVHAGRPFALLALTLASVALANGCFWRAGDLASGRGNRPRALAALLGFVPFAVACGSLAAGAPFELAMLPVLAVYVTAFVRFGLAFWRQKASVAARCLGGAHVVWGLWPVIVPYPLLRDTPYGWVGFFGASACYLLAGFGMQLYLAEEAFGREAEAVARYERLKRDFLSTVSHELRTPLSVVAGYLEILAEEDVPPAQGRAYAGAALTAASHLARLVDDLLDFSLLERGVFRLSPETFDVAELVRRAAATHAPRAEQLGLALAVRTPAEPLPLRADALRVEQVLHNLLGNALKFTPRGGRIDVSLAAALDGAILRVADTGVGIPETELPHVFETFYQADNRLVREQGGAGLGLPISKALLEAQGGSLEVSSEPGAGTVFTARLPDQKAPSS